MDVRNSIVLFGRAGEGKSTLANMLIQDDIGPDNIFPIGDSAVGETSEVVYAFNDDFEVYDTIGLCESSDGTIPHKKAIKKIRYYFSTLKPTFNYICYVKKGSRFTKEDKNTFKEFKKIFEGGERNFVIIITDSTPKWANDNVKKIRDYFGNYPIIAVDFPYNDRYNAEVLKGMRIENKQHLIRRLSHLRYNCVKLEVLEASVKFESKVAKVAGFIPIIGTAYNLITSGAYLILHKPNLAKRRFVEGLAGMTVNLNKTAIKY
ncbi:GTP-binding protein [Gigaspora margarita]|uniref:GTP-binding protein n=1 Tax=Gigaspora margarita TaxID=4874 RepID=A0A8H4AAB5_GIGMA|nr:GTP-binding protein [Gigaspora margarita]